MSMYEWAKNECKLALKKENPDFDIEGEEFDYAGSCYQSALKAYKCLCDDGHSGYSFSVTRGILKKLLYGHPLSPITESDFEGAESIFPDVDVKQCHRMFSLFRRVNADGTVTYNDNDRVVECDYENPDSHCTSFTCKYVDEMFPITLPYTPTEKPYILYSTKFLTDERNGDYDTTHIMYVDTPDGKRVDINRYFTEKDGKLVEIGEDEYHQLEQKRLVSVYEKIIHHFIWNYVDNFFEPTYEDEGADNMKKYKALEDSYKEEFFEKLKSDIDMAKGFNDMEWGFNTFRTIINICSNDEDSVNFRNEHEWAALMRKHLDEILDKIKQTE